MQLFHLSQYRFIKCALKHDLNISHHQHLVILHIVNIRFAYGWLSRSVDTVVARDKHSFDVTSPRSSKDWAVAPELKIAQGMGDI